MRSYRAQGILSGLCVVILLAAAGCGDDDVVVSSNLGLGGSVDGEYSPDGGISQADPVAVRSTTSTPAVRAGAGASDTTAYPSPPTLSQAGQAALATATTVAPPVAPATTPPTTPAPNTTDQATVASDTSDSTDTTATTALNPATSVVLATPAQLEAGEAHSNDLLTELRTSLGLPELTRRSEMDAFARDWSRQMAESGNFEHSSGPYGENIAFTSDVTLTPEEAADLFHQLWIGSPSHYANMTHDIYTASGVGIYLTEHGWYGTHVFSFG